MTRSSRLDQVRLFSAAGAMAHSSAVAAGVAGALVSAASLAFGVTPNPAVVILATAGTLVVYNVDRLRDLERDKTLAPARCAFVARNRLLLAGVVALAGGASIASALMLPRETWVLCSVVLVLGLLHRRLKRVRGIKTLYLAGSWLAVTIALPVYALPAAARPGFESLYWVTFIIGCAVLANLMASNVDRRRAHENPVNKTASRRLGPAIAVAGLGLGFAVVAPEALLGLAAIPGAELLALSRFREGETYTTLVLDGALLVGAACSIAFLL